MKRTAVVLAAFTILIGCGSGDEDSGGESSDEQISSTTTTPTTTTTTTIPTLEADNELLAALLPELSEMPAGWRASAPSEHDTSEACPGVPRARIAVPARSEQEVSYERPSESIIDIGELLYLRVAAYESTGGPAEWMTAARREISQCGPIPEDLGNGLTSIDTEASPGDLGDVDDAIGWSVAISSDGQPFGNVTGAAAAHGRYLVLGTGTTAAEVQQWVSQTVAKLPPG